MTTRLGERRRRRRGEVFRVAIQKRRHVWSEDASAEKADRGEKFVEFDREERRYLFHTILLPRLNATDLKFLYEVNTETRKLIKRSSRAGDLKETFKVREMSSISTLEFAWEHKSVGYVGKYG